MHVGRQTAGCDSGRQSVATFQASSLGVHSADPDHAVHLQDALCSRPSPAQDRVNS